MWYILKISKQMFMAHFTIEKAGNYICYVIHKAATVWHFPWIHLFLMFFTILVQYSLVALCYARSELFVPGLEIKAFISLFRVLKPVLWVVLPWVRNCGFSLVHFDDYRQVLGLAMQTACIGRTLNWSTPGLFFLNPEYLVLSISKRI